MYREFDIVCDFVIEFCVVYLVKAHRNLILSNAKESIQEKGTQSSLKKFSI